VSWKEFLTFEEKYMRGGKNAKQSGMESMDRRIPANIPDEQTKEIQELSKKVFKSLNSKGVVRVDYIIDKSTNEIFVNEINTIPGSFAFYLWTPKGMEYSKLIDRLVEIALKANEEKNKNNYSFKSDVIGNIAKGAKVHK
jgi:D-alanine-D-alanine ligase